jgi:tetratricopeptide (TPR) repeat protein
VEIDAGNRAAALDLAHAALTRAGELGDPLSEAEAHNTIGRIRLLLDSIEQAREHYRQALGLARPVGARQAEIGALLGLSAAHRHAARRAVEPQPAELAEQARALAAAAGYRMLEGQACAALAAARLAAGRPADAAATARQALTILRETGHRLGQVDALVTLGHSLKALNDVEASAACWQEALTVAGETDGTAAEDVRRLLAAP